LRCFAFDLRFWCLGRFFLSLERLNALGVRIVASLLVGSYPSVVSSLYHGISPKSAYLSVQRCSLNRCMKSTCRHLRIRRSTIQVQNWSIEVAWSCLQQECIMLAVINKCSAYWQQKAENRISLASLLAAQRGHCLLRASAEGQEVGHRGR